MPLCVFVFSALNAERHRKLARRLLPCMRLMTGFAFAEKRRSVLALHYTFLDRGWKFIQLTLEKSFSMVLKRTVWIMDDFDEFTMPRNSCWFSPRSTLDAIENWPAACCCEWDSWCYQYDSQVSSLSRCAAAQLEVSPRRWSKWNWRSALAWSHSFLHRSCPHDAHQSESVGILNEKIWPLPIFIDFSDFNV